MPLVHTTKSFNFRSIITNGELIPQECDVFLKEKLNYFFVGRPAYKYNSDTSSAEAWELPCCFIFESDCINNAKRVFPFDSGAFARKRYPDYINFMPLENFLSTETSSPSKIIGSFFGDAKRYFDMKPKSRTEFEQEYSLNAFDAEMLAVNRLSGESTPKTFDDRRFTIEIQTEEIIKLNSNKLIAVIIPEIYLSIDGVIEKIEGDWDAEAIGYPMYSLSTEMYYATIYREVHDLYKRKGFL